MVGLGTSLIVAATSWETLGGYDVCWSRLNNALDAKREFLQGFLQPGVARRLALNLVWLLQKRLYVFLYQVYLVYSFHNIYRAQKERGKSGNQIYAI